MEITITNQTPLARSCTRIASGFGMPVGGQSSFDILVEQRATWIPATGLMTAGSVVRDRKDLAAKGHVALVAYVPGYPAWSPPIC